MRATAKAVHVVPFFSFFFALSRTPMHRGGALAGLDSERHGSSGARSVFDARLFSPRPDLGGRTRHLSALSAASVLGDDGRRRRVRVGVALSVQKSRCWAHGAYVGPRSWFGCNRWLAALRTVWKRRGLAACSSSKFSQRSGLLRGRGAGGAPRGCSAPFWEHWARVWIAVWAASGPADKQK